MFRHDLTSQHYTKVYFSCFLLSFLSGSVNAGAFMASGSFVTHVTGFATLFGVDLIKGNFVAAMGILSVPFYFLLGAMISAYFIDGKIHEGKRPSYSFIMSLVCFCLLVVTLAGELKYFGIFGKEYNVKQDYFFLMLLCGASGIQNAAITTFSGSVVRTTHLTGVTTDLGIGLIRVFFQKLSGEKHIREIRSNWLRVITIIAFILGSIVGAYSFLKLHYLGFLIPALIAAYAAYLSRDKQSILDQNNAPRQRL